jgi:PadR family transcriptional regulator, regulatory protein PadR
MISKNLMAASTKPLILAILAKGEIYGYQIIQNVIEMSGGTLDWSEGMLYPVLHRLEKDRFIQAKWKISDNGRKRKYYSLTKSGRQELERERREWISVHELLSDLWKPSPAFK